MIEKYLGIGLLVIVLFFFFSWIETLFHFHDSNDDKVEFDFKDFDDIDHLAM